MPVVLLFSEDCFCLQQDGFPQLCPSPKYLYLYSAVCTLALTFHGSVKPLLKKHGDIKRLLLHHLLPLRRNPHLTCKSRLFHAGQVDLEIAAATLHWKAALNGLKYRATLHSFIHSSRSFTGRLERRPQVAGWTDGRKDGGREKRKAQQAAGDSHWGLVIHLPRPRSWLLCVCVCVFGHVYTGSRWELNNYFKVSKNSERKSATAPTPAGFAAQHVPHCERGHLHCQGLLQDLTRAGLNTTGLVNTNCDVASQCKRACYPNTF